MISLLAKLILKPEGKTQAVLRKGYGVLCGAMGIILNILLFLGKFLAGKIAGSIAITADAFNNLSDAGSSFVSMIGFQLAGQAPDPNHPFGHGRIEYLSGLAVSMLILLMGVELAQSSLDKIRHPAPVEFNILVMVILCVSIAVKLYMAYYNHAIGKKISSPSMLATASDSLSDTVSTVAVLIATLVGQFTGLCIDGWVGILVAIFIFISGLNAAKDTLNPLLGTPPSPEFVQQIRDLVDGHPGILGLHDLIVHDYGPGRVMISLHAEVPASGDVLELHDSIDNLEKELQDTLGCHAVIHMDPIVIDDELTNKTKKQMVDLVHCIDDNISIHDFRMVPGPTHTNVIFDAVVPFGFRLTDNEVTEKIQSAARALDKNYCAVVNVERSYT